MTRRFAPLRELLRASPVAAGCLDRSTRSDRLLEQVRALLPCEIRPHCLGAACTEGRLTLTLDAPAWATRMRFEVDALAAAFNRADGSSGVRSVKLRVHPARTAARPGARPAASAPRLTPAAIGHLLAAAEHLADPALREVFRRFAERHARGGIPPGTEG